MLIFLQGKLGDLFFDDERFSRARNVLAQMLRRNVRLVLEISPFISTESSSFSETSRLGLLVKQLESDIPALTSFKVSLHSLTLTFQTHSLVPCAAYLSSISTFYLCN